MTYSTHQSMKLVVAKIWSIRELDTKLTALPPVGDEFSVKVQRVKDAVLLISSASSGTKLSCHIILCQVQSRINYEIQFCVCVCVCYTPVC